MPKGTINYDTFMELQRERSLGVSQRKASENLGLTRGCVERWWHKGEQEWFDSDHAKGQTLEAYREFIVSKLKVYPQIRATNMYFQLKESFGDFECKRATFYRFFSLVREQSGFARFKERMISPREQLPPGYEAQVDFGQFKMLDMYGLAVRVYFFCIVLSYSQMRFAYFSRQPFNTGTAINAHEHAFKYFNGRTQTIMYDLDRVFVVNENYGNIVFVKEFEDYVKSVGFSTTMCRPRDPRTKGRVEQLVGYIKYSFLEGRTFCGIDSLNSACLNWLDTDGNGTCNSVTRKIPRELFQNESKYLTPTKALLPKRQQIISVGSKNSIVYNTNEYAMPKGRLQEQDRIRVDENGEELFFYKADTNEFIIKHKVPNGKGNVIVLDEDYADNVALSEVKRIFDNNEDVNKFIENISPKRYVTSQARQLIHLSKYYSKLQVLDAIAYCLRVTNCTATELAAYLIYKYGVITSRRCFSKEKSLMYSKRAAKIKEELNG